MAFYSPKRLRVLDTNDDNRHVDITILHGEEWSALFINGELSKAAEAYLIWEHLTALLNITEESVDNSLLFGANDETGTLADVRLRQQEAARREALAVEAEARAQALLNEAAELRKGF